MAEKQELIQKLREARKAKGLSYQKIVDLTEQNGEAVSLSTVRRVFAEESNVDDFRYTQTLRPIIRAVTGMDEELEPPDKAPTLEQATQDYMTIETLKAVVEHKSEMLAKAESEAQKKIEFLKTTLDDYKAANKWYKRVIGVLGIICFLAMVGVVLDLAIGGIGWIRY